MKKNAFNAAVCLFCFALPGFLFFGCSKAALYKDTRVLMGTFVEVTSSDKRAARITFDECKRVESLLSKYDPQSEICRLNRTGEEKVSFEVFSIIEQSKKFRDLTFGAFDITVGPLMDLWGFTNKNFRVPQESEIKHVLASVGGDKIVLRSNDCVIKFSVPGMKIDLGGIAKGYALDCAVKKLKEAGVQSCLINAGGQMFALGRNGGRLWKIAIRDARGDSTIGYLTLENQSVSTSGDYEQFFIKDSKRYSHILDPRSGYPADSGIISVTVVADDGLTADALSTSVYVLGNNQSAELLRSFPHASIKNIILNDVQNTR